MDLRTTPTIDFEQSDKMSNKTSFDTLPPELAWVTAFPHLSQDAWY